MFDKQRNKQSSVKIAETPAIDTPASLSSSSLSNNRRNAVIGSTIKIKGEVSGDEDLIIEGQVEGTISLLAHTVTIGATGKVGANICAKNIKIDGEVKGDITGGEKVIISKAGRVRGNIVAPRVTLEDGAQFKGSIDMDPGVATTAELPLSSVSSSAKRQGVAGSNDSALTAKNG